MYLVGTLQDYGSPYVSLFFDKDTNQLYLFVKHIDYPQNELRYLVTNVSYENIQDYLNEKVCLGDLFVPENTLFAVIQNGTVEITPETKDWEWLAKEGRFEPDFCFDKLKLKTFLKRYHKNVCLTA